MSKGIREHMNGETVADLAVRKPIIVTGDTPVRQVAEQLRQRQLGCALVVDAQQKPIGKFTQRQLMKLLLDGPGHLDEPVRQHMYAQADAITRTDTIAQMLDRMSQRQIRYLAVVDEAGKVVGLTGQKGLVEYLVDHFPRHIKVQRMRPLIALEEREGA